MMRFTATCSRCGATITLVPPWMHPVYSCGCGPSGLLFAFSTPNQAIQENIKMQLRPVTVKCVPLDNDELTPKRIARMYRLFRNESIEHSKTCGLCKAVAEQGLVCPDLEQLRLGRNKWLALMVAYPEEKKHD